MESMGRLKRNSDIWDNLSREKRDVEVNVREDGRENIPFRERKVHARGDSFLFKFLQRDLTDLNGQGEKKN